MTEDHDEGQSKESSLPPPAFPPGSRRIVSQRHLKLQADGDGQLPDDAIFDPDEPIVRVPRRGTPIDDDAFIDPDEPIVRTGPPAKPEDFEQVVRIGRHAPSDDDEVMVTGIGNDPHLDDPDIVAIERYGDPHVAALVEMVGRLAEGLRQKGESGLRTDPDMTRFEATLRGYCTGWLNGQRDAEDE